MGLQNHKLYKIHIFSLLLIVLAGCTTAVHQLNKSAETVNIVFDEADVEKCTSRGEVIGSEGHWYSFAFISNPALTRGALNNIKNNAQAMDADTVYIWKNLSFSTSVTFLGQAYKCNQ
jgi:hypothetical protein